MKEKYISHQLQYTVYPLSIWLMILGLYAFCLISQWHDFFPIYSDEQFYYQNAKAFWLTGKIKAAFTFDGIGSSIFGADAHGPFYPILFGLLGDMIGFAPINFLLLNLLLLFLTCWIFRSLITDLEKKNLICWFILAHPIIFMYSFTLMQEILNVILAVIICKFLVVINETKSKKVIIAFLFLLLVFSFFRPSYILWSWALLPIFWKRINFFLLGLSILGSILIAGSFQNLFFEEVPGFYQDLGEILKNRQLISAISSLTEHSWSNIMSYLTYTEGKAYTFTKIIYLLGWLMSGFLTFKKKSTLYWGIWIIYTLHFFLLITLYEAYGWKEIRILLGPFLISCYILIKEFNLPHVKTLISTSIIGLLLILPQVLRIHSYRKLVNHKELQKISARILDQLPSDSNSKDEIKIKVTEDILLKTELMALPLESKSGKKINYIIPYYPKKQAKADFELISEDGTLKKIK